MIHVKIHVIISPVKGAKYSIVNALTSMKSLLTCAILIYLEETESLLLEKGYLL